MKAVRAFYGRYLCSLFLFVLTPFAFSLAVPPVRPEFDPSGRTCFLSETAAQANALRNSGGLSGQSFPNPPDPAVLVIRVDFSDMPMTLTKTETDAFFVKVRDYYVENSYGVFIPSFTVTDMVHRLAGTLATYGADCGSDVACHDVALRQAAVSAENPTRDFSQFDHIMIYHAGNGQESSGQVNDIWSVYFPGFFSVDGKFFDGFTVVPEKEAGNVDPLGVICHEYGHQLGLPDLYDISVPGGASTVGSWDIMDYPYTAAPGQPLGSNPSHLGAWSKKFLGFLNPATLPASGSGSLLSVNVSSATDLFPVLVSDVGSANEYFIVEYRNKLSTATYDKGIAASGILIWHIDETIASNPARLNNNDINTPSFSGESHRGVDLVEADFTELYLGNTRGETTDVFNAGADFVTPLSNAFNGVPTGILLAGITGVESTEVQFFFETPQVSTFTLFSGVDLSTTLVTQEGFIQVSVPAGSFSDGSSFFISDISTASFAQLGSQSYVADFEATGVGCLLGAESNAQPARTIQLVLGFSGDTALASLPTADLARLAVARYDVPTQTWVPVLSFVNGAQFTVTAQLNHLSLFQIMKASPGSHPNEVKIFPNPMRPPLGRTYDVMNFSNLPSRSRIRIFTVSGEMVREFFADEAGLAVWDGLNSSGQKAASGIYFALCEDQDGGRREISKVGIER